MVPGRFPSHADTGIGQYDIGAAQCGGAVPCQRRGGIGIMQSTTGCLHRGYRGGKPPSKFPPCTQCMHVTSSASGHSVLSHAQNWYGEELLITVYILYAQEDEGWLTKQLEVRGLCLDVKQDSQPKTAANLQGAPLFRAPRLLVRLAVGKQYV